MKVCNSLFIDLFFKITNLTQMADLDILEGLQGQHSCKIPQKNFEFPDGHEFLFQVSGALS